MPGTHAPFLSLALVPTSTEVHPSGSLSKTSPSERRACREGGQQGLEVRTAWSGVRGRFLWCLVFHWPLILHKI